MERECTFGCFGDPDHDCSEAAASGESRTTAKGTAARTERPGNRSTDAGSSALPSVRSERSSGNSVESPESRGSRPA